MKAEMVDIELLENPPLAPTRRGPWELVQEPLPVHPIAGYYTNPQRYHGDNWILRNQETKTIWMSTAPMERESLALHAKAASGKVLVGGLGLGMLLWALLNKESVEHVVVVEKSKDIIALFLNSVLQRREWDQHFPPGSRGALVGPRVDIVHGDIFEFAPGKVNLPFDFGLIDIWPSNGDLKLRPDMQQLVATYPKVQQWAAWGMEFDFVSWLQQNAIPPRAIGSQHWGRYSHEIGAPLIGREWPFMSRLAFQAVVVQVLGEA